jgi:plastocyanin
LAYVRRALVLVIAGASYLLPGCASDDSSVSMEGHSFEPGSVTVQAGDPVSFTNDTPEAHTVTAYDDGLPRGAEYFATGGAQSEDEARSDIAAGLLQQGDKFELTLNVPGEYRYFCIPHEDDGMTGTIIVE